VRIVLINAGSAPSDLLEFVLRNAGHDIVTVRGGDGFRDANIPDTDIVIVRGDESNADGCQRCMQLRARRFAGPLIFVSRQTAMRDKVRAFEHGADDYIVEPFDSQELLSRVNAVMRRARRRDDEHRENELRVGAFELSMETLTVKVGDRTPVDLTPTEMRLLECLLRNPMITMSRETLIDRTWGYDFVGASNRLDVNILRLRKKLETDPTNPRHLLTIRGIGYVIRPSVQHDSADDIGALFDPAAAQPIDMPYY